MAETKTKSVAGMSQAEITIIEEKLSTVSGILPQEIATSLSNRFDKVLEEMNTSRSQLAYIQSKYTDPVERIKKIKEINEDKKRLQAKRQELISGWYKKVVNYIEKVYGEPIKSENGLITAYGAEGRIEVMENRHLKKLW